MSRPSRRTPLADPTAERTADQSTQENGGLHRHQDVVGSRSQPEPADERNNAGERNNDDALSRDAGKRYSTPRRYDGAGAQGERKTGKTGMPDSKI